MSPRPPMLSCCCAALLAALPVLAQAPASQGEPAEPAAFTLLKTTLVGNWVLAGEDGEAGSGVDVSYRTTGAGSALVETMFAGTPKEMTTVYHCDGAALLLTHYCAAGNQPRMRMAAGDGAAGSFAFEFDGGTNLDAAVDVHMHAMSLRIEGADAVHFTWHMFQGGEEIRRVELPLRRVRAQPTTRPAATPAAGAAEGGPQQYGAGVSSFAAVPVAAVLADPKKFAGQTTLVAGPVVAVCPKKGCWMRVGGEEENLFVKFKDYGFFVPVDTAAGTIATLEGVVSVEEQSVEEVRHYLEDAGKHDEAAKVTAPRTVVSFLATGVALADK